MTDVGLLSAQCGSTQIRSPAATRSLTQAVSWAKSRQTHFWHPGEAVAPGGQDPHCDDELIGRLVATIDSSSPLKDGMNAQGAQNGIGICGQLFFSSSASITRMPLGPRM